LIWKILLGVIVLGGIYWARVLRPQYVEAPPGVRGDMVLAIAGLMDSTDKRSFLIVEIANTKDFIQFSGSTDVVQMDFPLVTQRQKDLRSDIEKACSELGLDLELTPGSTGEEFLDYNLKGSSESISNTIRQVLERVHGVTGNEQLLFSASGFALNTDSKI